MYFFLYAATLVASVSYNLMEQQYSLQLRSVTLALVYRPRFDMPGVPRLRVPGEVPAARKVAPANLSEAKRVESPSGPTSPLRFVNDVPCLADYDFIDVVGRGGYGVVYKAREVNSGEIHAIKVISKEKTEQNGLLERVVKEIEVHHRLEHTNIVNFYAFTEDAKFMYLIMEYCSGGNLYDMLKRHRRETGGGVGNKRAAQLIYQLGCGVAYLHRNNVMHRDLKLSNLLLSSKGELKIADFGLAVILDHPDEEHYTVCGTTNYIAPEVAVPQQGHGLSADLWSVGVVLYSLLVGRLPFDCKTTSEILHKVCQAKYELPAHISRKARDLIGLLLHRIPGRRLEAKNIIRHSYIISNHKPNGQHTHKTCQRFPSPSSSEYEEESSSGLATMAVSSLRAAHFAHLSRQSSISSIDDSPFIHSSRCDPSKSMDCGVYQEKYGRREHKHCIHKSFEQNTPTEELWEIANCAEKTSSRRREKRQRVDKDKWKRDQISSTIARTRSDSLGSSAVDPSTPLYSGVSSITGVSSMNQGSVEALTLLRDVEEEDVMSSNTQSRLSQERLVYLRPWKLEGGGGVSACPMIQP